MRGDSFSAGQSGRPGSRQPIRRTPITAWPTGSGLPLWVTGRVTSCGLVSASEGSRGPFVVRLSDLSFEGTSPEPVEQVTAAEVMRRVAEVGALVGGVVITGGEPFAQPGFTSAVLHLSHERGLDTTMETTGRMSSGASDRMLDECDLVVLDLPTRDVETFVRLTGGPVTEPFRFLERLRRLGRPVHIRVPVVAR